MYYSQHTTKETVIERVKQVIPSIKEEQLRVIKLDDDNDQDITIVLFQIIIMDKLIYLNDLLCLGLAPYNPSINTSNEGWILITFTIDKIK